MRTWLFVMFVAACGSGAGDGTGTDGGNGGSGSGGGSGLAAVRSMCVAQTNTYRAENGKPALTESSTLETYADTGAQYDFTNGPHSHFESTSGGGIAFAENECPGSDGWTLPPGGDLGQLVLQCLAAFYSEGPGSDYSTHGHYINMMGSYATLGCGFYQSGEDVTIIQDYGN